MAATNETTNYGLPQWESTDKPEMADFNQAMSDIDTNLNLVQSISGSQSVANGVAKWVKFSDGTMFEHRYITPTWGTLKTLLGLGSRSTSVPAWGDASYTGTTIPTLNDFVGDISFEVSGGRFVSATQWLYLTKHFEGIFVIEKGTVADSLGTFLNLKIWGRWK